MRRIKFFQIFKTECQKFWQNNNYIKMKMKGCKDTTEIWINNKKHAKTHIFRDFSQNIKKRRGLWKENSKTASATLMKNLFGNFAK